ncbi:lysine-rich nucleolar protein 1 isoform X5 [Prionailurus viverrinus]|uniref:lysine-rich nucleolar protein 1 isoform X5 n=1 Tax=Prionailurus viverrinus TaxID=61388 RepID=UPI001FF2C12F|nr:lysine-rich nucleolar protein 1 isoform X5 [Prionailurus viverrinus]
MNLSHSLVLAWLLEAANGMITKTHKGDLGLGLPEKKKKKKKVVKELETQYSVLNSDNYFTEICPTKATSPSKSVVLGQASEMPLVKKKKKKKGHSTLSEQHLEPETTLRAGRTEKLPSPRKQALGSSEFQGGEKKKKRKSLWPPAMSPGSRVKTFPDPRQGEEVTSIGKKPKKHKKEKKAQEAAAFSAKDPWFCESGDSLYACSVGKDGEEQTASGRKRKQESPREHNVKMKKKKKIHQKGDTSLGHLELSKSIEGIPRKGSKKPVKVEAPEYIPIEHNPKSPAKKKMKAKKKAEQPGIEEPALRRNKKKKEKESRVAGEPCKEGTQFGQWDTAGFENEEQKLKFLKLMGGFKNGSPSFSRPPNMTGRPNMALNKKAADTLRQNLQQDYDRAMSWKYSRGAGLGFSTTPDKIFYIDRNASKSIKFED